MAPIFLVVAHEVFHAQVLGHRMALHWVLVGFLIVDRVAVCSMLSLFHCHSRPLRVQHCFAIQRWAFSWVIPWLRTCKDLYIQALDIEIWNSQKMDAARITHLHGLEWQTYSHMLAFLSIRQPRRDVLNEQSLVLLKAGPR